MVNWAGRRILMTSKRAQQDLSPDLRQALREAHHRDETACVQALLDKTPFSAEASERITARARGLVEQVRHTRKSALSIDTFLLEYELSTPEGVALMCLAEALLRIPDTATQDKLIRDKIVPGDWDRHLGHGGSVFVNASTWALMLSGRLLDHEEHQTDKKGWGIVGALANRVGDAVLREAVSAAMRILGRQFVLGRTLDEALHRAADLESRGFTYSYDILGEAALTATQAEHHFDGYVAALKRLRTVALDRAPDKRPEISVKLSALHPRYAPSQVDRIDAELVPRVIDLARLAADADIGLTIDAEESELLEPCLNVLDAVSREKKLCGWNGLGLVVQAYQKRAFEQIGWLEELARRDKRRLNIRLVKGAYWDREVKRAQVAGLNGYPVFTRKASTDVSYLVCAQRLLASRYDFFTQFASHNAHTIAAVMELVGAGHAHDVEFQKLHGMGDELFDIVFDKGWPCRVYAPVGEHEDLLPYLVRRLLENGANTSFVNRIADAATPLDRLIADPVQEVRTLKIKPHPRIPLPGALFDHDVKVAKIPSHGWRNHGWRNHGRRNSEGVDLDDISVREPLMRDIAQAANKTWAGGSIVGGHFIAGDAVHDVCAPFDRTHVLGSVHAATSDVADQAFDVASQAFEDWTTRPAAHRAACLERAADLYEEHRVQLMALVVNEAGKTLDDAVAELREAVDFLRYYANRARLDFAHPERNPGPTGERNETHLSGRGVFACISPWNFPLAIFTGQVAAALAAGNAVVAKPAATTPLIATQAVHLLHQAGVPGDVLHLLVGPSAVVGDVLVKHSALAGVAFTGSMDTAHTLNRALAARPGLIVPLIAETGGQNAMIADSSALLEQVTADVLTSAFHSAGQRCSALRVLFVQTDVADKMMTMIAGAMDELRIGNPNVFTTDIGPLIDGNAVETMWAHSQDMSRKGRLVAKTPLDNGLAEQGAFFAPRAFEVDDIETVGGEVFGPILHIVRYGADKLDGVIDAINATGYGLTLGVHSRIEQTIDHICRRARVGNIYVNRNQIGAVVGVQPFGGEGLSGTGPKAGGPRYLYRFATERTVSTDTTASGGNATLMTLDGDEVDGDEP